MRPPYLPDIIDAVRWMIDNINTSEVSKDDHYTWEKMSDDCFIAITKQRQKESENEHGTH